MLSICVFPGFLFVNFEFFFVLLFFYYCFIAFTYLLFDFEGSFWEKILLDRSERTAAIENFGDFRKY